MEEKKRNPDKRTKKRSRSGAHTQCPLCGKRLRGRKGLITHLMEVHSMSINEAKTTSEGLKEVA